MKDQYFGDVNDYRKYGLLRALAGVSGLPLGICWMLTARDGRSDGEFRRYLDQAIRCRRHDPQATCLRYRQLGRCSTNKRATYTRSPGGICGLRVPFL
jgi:hypothetical protein